MAVNAETHNVQPTVSREQKGNTKKSPWDELLASAKGTVFEATKEAVLEGGVLIVPHGSEKERVPVGQINSVSFSPSGVAENTKLDMIVYVQEKPGIRIYVPKYMGTMDRDSEILSQTKKVLGELRIKYKEPKA